MLWVEGLSKSFGGLQVVQDCSLRVEPGEIVGLIGPNGAGKTTLFNMIAGDLQPDRGRVRLEEVVLTGLSPDAVARQGLVRTFQVPREFGRMPVIDNLMVAAPRQLGESFLAVWLQPGRIRRQEREIEERAWEVLRFLGLRHVANQPAASLSGGQKKLLELGRALMVEPRILLLDEPVAGVNPSLARDIADRIRALREQGMTFLIIEHNMSFIMGLSDRIYVMAQGRILTEGTPAEVRANQQVVDAYLGVV